MSDAEIYACFQKHDAARIGRRGSDERTAIEAAAAELGVPYQRVRDVVMQRIAMGFAG